MNPWIHAVYVKLSPFPWHYCKTTLDPFSLVCNTSHCAVMMTSPPWLLLNCFERQSGTWHGVLLLCGPSSLRYDWFDLRCPPAHQCGTDLLYFWGPSVSLNKSCHSSVTSPGNKALLPTNLPLTASFFVWLFRCFAHGTILTKVRQL